MKRRVVLRVAPSMWPDRGLHWVDGRKYPPVLLAVRDGRWVFGRGFVLAVAGVMLWFCREMEEVR